MCGRFTFPELDENPYTVPPTKMFNLKPRYNVAPSQMVAAVRLDQNGNKELVMLKWGLIPSWAKDPKIAYSLINARAETVRTKPSFRDAFRNHRCLILADGFYEWKKDGATKQPYYFQLKDKHMFAFAGLWDSWKNPMGQILETCTIITCVANETVKPVHERMPVILEGDDQDLWLNPKIPNGDLLLNSLPENRLSCYPVSTKVNGPKFDDPSCVEPLRA